MKLNQATAAAAILSTINLASSSADSARDEFKEKIAPLLASMPNRYLLRNRMLQSRNECVADYNALRCQCVSNRDELKDKIAPLLASRSIRYLLRNRMLQSSGDDCVQAMIDD